MQKIKLLAAVMFLVLTSLIILTATERKLIPFHFIRYEPSIDSSHQEQVSLADHLDPVMVFNPVSFIKRNHVWTVYFQTKGRDTLIIEPLNSSFGEFPLDDPHTKDELTNTHIYCGKTDRTSLFERVENINRKVAGNITRMISSGLASRSQRYSRLIITGWECDEAATLTTTVLIPGYAALKLSFRGSTSWAYDPGAAPTLTLDAPANDTRFPLNLLNITLNVTVNDGDGDPLSVWLFGGNTTSTSSDWMLYVNYSASNANMVNYNWTSPVVNNNSLGLIGLWHFDNRSDYYENDSLAYDSHNGKFNMTCSRSGCPNWTNPSKIGGGFYFNGSVHFNSSFGNALNSLKNATITAWVYPLATVGMDIVNKYEAGDPTLGFYVGMSGSSFTMVMSNGVGAKTFTTIPIYSTNSWYHVAFVYNGSDSSNLVKIYVSGYNVTSSQSGVAATSLTATTYPLRVGSGVNTNYWNGTIDELAIWNRSLDAQEVLNLYRLGEGRYYWKANVSDGTLGGESPINMFEVGREIPPRLLNWTTNDSAIYYADSVAFNVTAYDYFNLSHALLATNMTGSLMNESVVALISGSTAVGSIARTITATPGNTTGWIHYVNDTDGNWNQTINASFPVGGLTWSKTTITVPTANVNSIANFTNTTFTSYLPNTNVNLTCISGNCNVVTSNYSMDTYANNVIGSLWFTCDTAASGTFAATFKLNSTEFKGAANVSVTCTIFDGVVPIDLSVAPDSITFSNSTPAEGQNITINATLVNLGGGAASSFNVSFFDGNYTSNDNFANMTISSLDGLSNTTISMTWIAEIGQHDIFVVVDPPVTTGGTISESDETNNYNSSMVTISNFHITVGNISGNLLLSDASNRTVFLWQVLNNSDTNVYVVDTDSSVQWSSLWSISRYYPNSTYEGEDFAEIDALLQLNGSNTMNATYTTLGQPKQTANVSVFGTNLLHIPTRNSTNSSLFVTGILWDTSDGGASFNQSLTQDLVFVAKAREKTRGQYGTYDYEISYPANLRKYKGPDSNQVAFYIELK